MTRPSRLIILIGSNFLPWMLKRRVLGALGYRIHPSARIGLSVIDASQVDIAAGARVGHGNVIRHLREFRLGRDVQVRHANTFSGAAWPGWPCSVRIEDRAKIMNGNYFDVGGRILLEEGSTLGGRDSQIWTHEVTGDTPRLRWREVRIGAEAYVAARCILLPGSTVPAGGTLAAGSVLPRSVQAPEGSLLAGNPARVLRSGDGSP